MDHGTFNILSLASCNYVNKGNSKSQQHISNMKIISTQEAHLNYSNSI